MLVRILIIAAYYVVAFAVLGAWVFREFEAAKRRAQSSGLTAAAAEAGRFANRTSLVLGLLGGGGAALVFGVLLTPAPSAVVIAGAGVATFVVAALLLEAFLRFAPRVLHADPLAELRRSSAFGQPGAPAPADAVPDEPEPPCLD